MFPVLISTYNNSASFTWQCLNFLCYISYLCTYIAWAKCHSACSNIQHQSQYNTHFFPPPNAAVSFEIIFTNTGLFEERAHQRDKVFENRNQSLSSYSIDWSLSWRLEVNFISTCLWKEIICIHILAVILSLSFWNDFWRK